MIGLRSWMIALAGAAVLGAGINDGVKGIKVGLGNNPPGRITALVDTDEGGNFSFSPGESGTYVVQVAVAAGQRFPLVPGAYTIDIQTKYRFWDQKHKDWLRARSRPRLWVVPESPAGILYQETVVVTRMPAKIVGTIRPANPIVSTNAVTFLAEEGGPLPRPQSITVTGAGEPAFDYEIQTTYKHPTGRPPVPEWLTLSSERGAYRPPPDRLPEITLTPNTRGLAAGIYQGRLRICVTTPSGTTIYIYAAATLYVKPRGQGPGLNITRSGLVFTAAVGANADPATTQLCNPSSAPVTWAAAVPAAQAQILVLAPTQGTIAPGACTEVRATAATRTLAAGVTQVPITINRTPALHAWIFVAAANCAANAVYPVVLSGPGEAVPGVGNNYEVTAVDNCGRPAAQAVVKASVDGGPPVYERKAITKTGSTAGFLTIAPESSEESVEVTFTAAVPVAQPQQREYTVITKSSSNIKNNFPVVSPDTGSPANPGGAGAAAPGSAVRLRVVGWDQKQGTKAALSDTIEGVSVWINGKKSPLLYTSPQELVTILPTDLPPGPHTMMLETPEGFSMPVDLDVAVAHPAIYTQDGSGDGEAIVSNVTRGGMVSEGNPARAEDVLAIYVDGLGAVDPAIPDGQAAPSDPLSQAVNPVAVTIGGMSAEVLFAGPVPGFTGFGQITFKTPPGFTGPTAVREEEIHVQVGGVGSQQSATTWFAQTRTRTAQVTVATNPAGLAVFVDGVRVVTPRVFDWAVDSVHTVVVATPQNETATGRLMFLNWNGDTYSQSLSVTADDSKTVVANFLQQFKLTTAVTLPAGTAPTVPRPNVLVTPASPDGFYNAGTQVRLAPGVAAAFRFANWTGDATGTANPLIVTMTGAKSVTAVYQVAPVGPAPGPAPGPGPGLLR